ncbi:hypothetical protein [Ciceribacter selenitireducens]
MESVGPVRRRSALKVSYAERHADPPLRIGGKRLTYRRAGEASRAQAESTSNHCFEVEKGEVLAGFAFPV